MDEWGASYIILVNILFGHCIHEMTFSDEMNITTLFHSLENSKINIKSSCYKGTLTNGHPALKFEEDERKMYFNTLVDILAMQVKTCTIYAYPLFTNYLVLFLWLSRGQAI